MGDALGMATMIFADEVINPDSLDEVAETREVKTTKRELEIAVQLVQSLAAQFEPEKYHDSYREEVLALIDRKAQGEHIAVQPAAEEVQAPAPDLMSALKASLEAARANEQDGAGASAAKRKRAPRKAPAAKPPAGSGAPAAGKASAAKAPAAKAAGGTRKSSSSRAAARR